MSMSLSLTFSGVVFTLCIRFSTDSEVYSTLFTQRCCLGEREQKYFLEHAPWCCVLIALFLPLFSADSRVHSAPDDDSDSDEVVNVDVKQKLAPPRGIVTEKSKSYGFAFAKKGEMDDSDSSDLSSEGLFSRFCVSFCYSEHSCISLCEDGNVAAHSIPRPVAQNTPFDPRIFIDSPYMPEFIVSIFSLFVASATQN